MAASSSANTCETTTHTPVAFHDHPEVLDRETLIQALNQRGMPLKEISELEKTDLVSLFYRYVAPLPQRLHQLRRGKRRPPKPPEKKDKDPLEGLAERSRKRTSSEIAQDQGKYAKSDLSHIIINKGPTRHKPDTSASTEDILNKNDSLILSAAENDLKRHSQEKTVKAKPIKLNRRSLPCNTSTSLPHPTSGVEDNKVDGCEASTKTSSLESMDEDVSETKKKFKKIAVTWP